MFPHMVSHGYLQWLPIPVAARSQAWVCGRSLAGIASSNPTWGMDVLSLMFCALTQRCLREAYRSSRGVLADVLCLTDCYREASTMRRPWPTRGCRAIERKISNG
jgi:hypothetical protein